MKKYLIALSAFTIMTVAASAQVKGNGSADAQSNHSEKMEHKKMGQKHDHNKGMMMKQLNLSDAQKQQAKTFHESYKSQFKELEKNKNSMSLQDYQSKKEALRKEQRSKFESILTGEQKSKMADLKKDQGAKRVGIKENRMNKMKSDLNLTDAQASKLQIQHAAFKAQSKSIKENNSLSKDQKKEQLADLRNKKKESEKNILTAQQFQKKELKNNRMNEMKNKRTERS